MAKDRVSCIIPAYNEAGRVGNVVRVAKQSPFVGEVIVVSDGSNDRTVEEAREAGASRVIELGKNRGKGGAVYAGVRVASFSVLLLLDADLLGLTQEHIQSLVEPLLSGEADMTIGVLAADRLQQIVPHISGQRALKKDFIMKHPTLEKCGFRFEVLLNHYARKGKQRVRLVLLENLSHRLKKEKYGKKEAYKMSSKMAYDLMRPWTYLTIFSSYLAKQPPLYPEIAPPVQQDRVLVIVAHPDDEVIGSAGYLSRAVHAGADVEIVVVTNGDANKFSTLFFERRMRLNSQKFIKEGDIRAQETLAALAQIGISDQKVHFFGFPDRGLTELKEKHWSRSTPYRSPYTRVSRPPYAYAFNPTNTYSGEDLLKNIEIIFKTFRPTKLITHSIWDSHPDHRTTAEFVAMALDRLKQEQDFILPERYALLVHYDDYPRPFRYKPHEHLLPPKELVKAKPDIRWVVFSLQPDEVRLKRAAMSAFKSQLKSPFLNLLLKSFIRRNELFLAE